MGSDEELAKAYADAVLEDASWKPVVRKSLESAPNPDRARDLYETAVEEQGREYRQDAYHDHLTGLPNQRAFQVELDQLADQAERAAHPEKRERKERTGRKALVGLDLENFGDINNAYGWTKGSEVLTDTARAFEDGLRPGDVVARIGGDELALLLDNVDDPEEVFRVLRRVEPRLPENPVTGRPVRINPEKLVVRVLSQADPPEKIRTSLEDALAEMRKAEDRDERSA